MLEKINETLENSSANRHPFLSKFVSQDMNTEQIRRFAMQWYLSAKDHKEALPALVLNTIDDDIRFDLINILYDEYGNGKNENIHAKLLKNFLYSIGFNDGDILQSKKIKNVEIFGEEVKRIWKSTDYVYAFSFHYSLEYLAQGIHKTFCTGLNKLNRFKKEDLEYFNYHSVAEEQHADYSVRGILKYAETEENHHKINEGVNYASTILSNMWDDFDQYVFSEN